MAVKPPRAAIIKFEDKRTQPPLIFEPTHLLASGLGRVLLNSTSYQNCKIAAGSHCLNRDESDPKWPNFLKQVFSDFRTSLAILKRNRPFALFFRSENQLGGRASSPAAIRSRSTWGRG